VDSEFKVQDPAGGASDSTVSVNPRSLRRLVLQINCASGTRFGYVLWQETLYGSPSDISQ
jgi:hypothetical protein